MKRKSLLLALLLCTILVFTACGSKEDAQAPAEPEPAAEEGGGEEQPEGEAAP